MAILLREQPRPHLPHHKTYTTSIYKERITLLQANYEVLQIEKLKNSTLNLDQGGNRTWVLQMLTPKPCHIHNFTQLNEPYF